MTRPRRARWSPWRRTLILHWTVGAYVIACDAVVAITVVRGIQGGL